MEIKPAGDFVNEKEDGEVKKDILLWDDEGGPAKKPSEMPTLVPCHVDYWFKTMEVQL